MNENEKFAQKAVIEYWKAADEAGLDVPDAMEALAYKAAETAKFMLNARAHEIERCEITDG